MSRSASAWSSAALACAFCVSITSICCWAAARAARAFFSGGERLLVVGVGLLEALL